MPTTRSFAALAVAGLLSTNALAQGDPRTHPGSLSIKPDVHLGKEIPAGPQRTAEFAAAQSVLDVLRADAALTNPIGYTVVVKRLASARLPGDAPGMPYHAAILGAIDYFGLEDNGRGGKEIGPTGGNVPFHVAINTFGDQGEIESTDEEVDHGPRVLYDLKETGKFRGRPVYNGACTYIAHRPVPPLIPLTKERYYTLELVKARSASANHQSQRAAETTTPTNDALQRFLRDRPKREASNRQTIDAVRKMGGDTATIRQMTEAFRDAEKQQEAGLRSAAAGGGDQRYQEIVKQASEGEAANISQIQANLDALSPGERKSPAYLIDHGRGMYTLGTKDDDGVVATCATESVLLRSVDRPVRSAATLGVSAGAAGRRRLDVSDVRGRRTRAGKANGGTTPSRRHPDSRQVELGRARGPRETVTGATRSTGPPVAAPVLRQGRIDVVAPTKNATRQVRRAKAGGAEPLHGVGAPYSRATIHHDVSPCRRATTSPPRRAPSGTSLAFGRTPRLHSYGSRTSSRSRSSPRSSASANSRGVISGTRVMVVTCVVVGEVPQYSS